MSTLNINQDEKKSATRWLRSISKYITKWVYLSSFVGFAGSLLLIWQMYLLSYIVYQAYFHSAGVDQLKSSFIILLLIVFARALLAWLKDVISFKSSLKIRTLLRQKVLAHINELGPVHAGALSSAQLTSSLTEQIESLHDYLMYYLPQMNLAVFVPIAMLCFIFPISIVSGLILMVCAPLIPLFMALIGMGASSIHQKHFQTIARMNARFLDIIQGLTTLKLFGKSQQQLTKIHQACDLVRINIMRVLKVAFLSSAVLEVFAAASIALLAVYLGMGFLNAGMDNAMWWELDDMTLHGALFILLLAPEFFMP
jgi:ATP-binding cassette subfamily C protein CydD